MAAKWSVSAAMPGPLHLGQHADQRQLDLVQQPVGAALVQVLVQRVGQLGGGAGRAAPGRPPPRPSSLVVLAGQVQRELPGRRAVGARSSLPR